MRRHACNIYHLGRFLTIPALIDIYSAFIEPHLRYGLLTWGGTTPTTIDAIKRQQKSILGAILGHQRAGLNEENDYFKRLNILPIQALHKYVLILEFYRNKVFREPVGHPYGTRQAGRFVEPMFSNDYGRQSFRALVPRVFNGLPEELVEPRKISVAKKEIKGYLLSEL